VLLDRQHICISSRIPNHDNPAKPHVQSTSNGVGTGETSVLQDSSVTVRSGRDDTDIGGVLDGGEDSGSQDDLLVGLADVDDVDTYESSSRINSVACKSCCRAVRDRRFWNCVYPVRMDAPERSSMCQRHFRVTSSFLLFFSTSAQISLMTAPPILCLSLRQTSHPPDPYIHPVTAHVPLFSFPLTWVSVIVLFGTHHQPFASKRSSP